ncbi:MAG: hypothetical protein IPJ81_07250 [Chitinophagaceae bacterium]|nr:hypothetical protein [Chitinophagaceae bacterium]
MTIDSDSPDERLVEITDFSKYKYDDLINYSQKFNVLPTHFQFAGDYRAETEIRVELEKVKIFKESQ